ncbi:MAG: 3-oxoacyl-ACP reductase [Acidimicrobiaceae bacterium]|mgnify:CR=1 FL=1|jgi:NAD(P)-dependent dehydrogenase (short-subunit alcohol dehydrogenase family)|nr:3-oxoacyl-ACP reductase [Acidimicrobiaceae bacterium]|tara:strand:- start:78719 stop:79492 length:774 start_codon:yes stop_codon:yes gene_type:complete
MKSLIVTGGASGLGRAIAKRASQEGFRVGILDVNVDALEETVSTITNSVALVASVTSAEEISAAIAAFGQTPDVWVNNAGIVRFAPLLALSIEDWRSVVEVNLTGTFICSTIVAKAMADRGSGSIVNITSINGISAGTNSGAYGATKSAISLLTQQMSLEWGNLGLRVNSLAPGLIDGGMSEPIYSEPEFRKLRTEKVPLGRLGAEEDIAEAVLFLGSDKASYITGHELVVDGGIINSIIANLPRPSNVDSVGLDEN